MRSTDTPSPTPIPNPAADGHPARRSLRILAADPDRDAREVYESSLPVFGHQVCVVGTGRQATDLCPTATPDLVIADVRLPDADGFGLAAALNRDRFIPVILVSAGPDAGTVWDAADGPVLGYLAKPLRPAALGAAVAVAARTADRLAASRAEAAGLRQALEDRKLVERAKGTVMKYAGMSEDSAYLRMRRLASEKNRKLVDVARSLLAAGEVFAQLTADDPPHRDGPGHHPNGRGGYATKDGL